MRPLYVFALGGLFGAVALGALWWQHGHDEVTVVERAPAGVYNADATESAVAPLPSGSTPAAEVPAPAANDDAYQLAAGDTLADATTSPHADAIAMGPPAPGEPQVLDPAAVVAGPPAPTPLDAKVQDLATAAPAVETSPTAPSGDASVAGKIPEPPATPDGVTIPGTSLMIPVEGIQPGELTDTFTQARAGGARVHDAIDIMAPAGKKVFAVADGKIEKLFLSKPGGLTIYQFDTDGKYAYYYAHLQSYAPGLVEGQVVKRGDVIGFVGSTGNADPKAPHLHFAVMQLGPDKRGWDGIAINPYPVFVPADAAMAGGGN